MTKTLTGYVVLVCVKMA